MEIFTTLNWRRPAETVTPKTETALFLAKARHRHLVPSGDHFSLYQKCDFWYGSAHGPPNFFEDVLFSPKKETIFLGRDL